MTSASSPPSGAAEPPQRSLRRSVFDVIGIAASTGFISGGLHGMSVWVQRLGLGRLTFHSRDAIWMAPLGTAITFATLALVAAVVAALLRRRISDVWTVGAFGCLGTFSVLLPYGEIARWAAALFAFGVAVQLVRAMRAAPRRTARRIVTVGIWFAIVASTLAIGERTVSSVSHAKRQRALPAADAEAFNVLLVVLDTVRAESLSLYGYGRPTSPALDQWAARGVVFDHAIATAPWTLPSHGSLFTGELPQRLGGSWVTPLSDSLPTLGEVLRDRGYRTLGIAGNLLYTSYESGLARGFQDYRDYPLSFGQVLLHSPVAQTEFAYSLGTARSFRALAHAVGEFNLDPDHLPADEFIPAASITDGFLQWQAGVAEQPFFAFLNYFNAHDPYRPVAEYEARFAATGDKRDRYDAAIATMDAELRRLLDGLDARGVLGRTIVVVTSDHGELFGEHNLYGHADELYLPVLRVPLAIIAPSRIPAGVRISEPVSLRDVPATLLDLAQGAGAGMVSGSSLAPLWQPARRGNPPSAAISHVMAGDDPTSTGPNARTWLESVVDGQHHYIRSGLGLEELYAWRTDSLEQRNLANTPSGAEIIRQLRADLSEIRRRR